MTYYTIPPPLSLSRIVRFFWVLESDQPYCHRSMADGSVEMIFHYKGVFNEITPGGIEKSFTAGLHGPSDSFREFVINQAFGIFGVYLYPFAIPLLFSVSSDELGNQMPDLAGLTGGDGIELEEKMMTAFSNRARLSILINFLEKRLRQNPKEEPAICSAIRQVIHTRGTIPVHEIARRAFLSTRQFERKFRAYAGFSPKLYSRIVRFQSATQHYGILNRSLTNIAYDCGYYDQSHFIHDFKQFSGYHPKHYFSGKAEGVEWRNASG